ncbi:MAG TPA: signal peptide peptidase SppA [Candidatus Acidoferrales bacterium]|nr:signal peptide peptidase SppA [Candidatus Acidoferrales bacterium]
MTWGKRRALVIVLVIVAVVILIIIASQPARVASNSVLVLDVSGEINEQRAMDIFSAIGGEFIPVQHDFVDALDTAKSDPHIDALVVKIGPLATGWGKLEEIRSHILAFRTSGKPSVCYLGGDGIGNLEYYVASACDKIWLVPTAPVSIHGMMAEALFLRGTLDKLKIYPDYYHIAEYKTASNQLTEKKFTPAHREEVDSLLHGIYNQYLTEVSQARNMDRTAFEKLVEQGPLSADEALNGKLVDRLAYWDQVQDFVREKTKDWNPVKLGRYRSQIKNDGGTKIAVVHATGLIVSGESGNTPGGGAIMGSESVAADLRKAREDSGIKAIVLRVDSGGGSAVASEVIRREVVLAKGVKPVVVSMSDVAASGGYWIAMSANKIVADPDTITASIGVLGGKLNISGLYGMLGLSTDSIATSENATIFSAQQNFTPAQQKLIQKSLQDVYANFTKGVAEGRHMTVEAVDKIGKGRVWTGAQGKELGLVDELGDLDHAVGVAKQLAGIPAERRVRIVRFPEEKTFLQMWLERQKDDSAQLSSIQAAVERLTGAYDTPQARLPFELQIR